MGRFLVLPTHSQTHPSHSILHSLFCLVLLQNIIILQNRHVPTQDAAIQNHMEFKCTFQNLLLFNKLNCRNTTAINCKKKLRDHSSYPRKWQTVRFTLNIKMISFNNNKVEWNHQNQSECEVSQLQNLYCNSSSVSLTYSHMNFRIGQIFTWVMTFKTFKNVIKARNTWKPHT